jgi:hypothetical protein
MLPNSNGELECAADLYKVCASVAQQQAEVGAIFSFKKRVLCSPTLIIHLILPSLFLKVKFQL